MLNLVKTLASTQRRNTFATVSSAQKATCTLQSSRNITSGNKKTYYSNTPVESLPKQWIARAKAWDIVKEANAPKDVFHWGGAPTHETASHNNYLSLVFPSQKFIQRVSFASDVSRPQDLIPPKHELLKTAMVAIVDGTTWDLMRPLPATAKRVEIVDFNHPLGVDTLWHSSAHILGQALEYYYRDHTVYLSDGPALKEGGYFYDLYIQNKDGEEVSISTYDMPEIASICKSIIQARQPFERIDVPVGQARSVFGENPFKQETLSLIASKYAEEHACSMEEAEKKASVSLYRCGPLIDLCRGPHINHTGVVGAAAVIKTSSSLLKEKIPFISTSLANLDPITHVQRVYGISFPEKSQLKDWENARLLAEKSDHRKIGKTQNLFAFHPLSPGSAFFMPHGTRIYNRLMEFLRGEYLRRGYSEVRTPLVFDKALWERSGHWVNYKEDMFYVSKGNSAGTPELENDSEKKPKQSPPPVQVPGLNLQIPQDLSPEELRCIRDTKEVEEAFASALSERCQHTHAHTHEHHGAVSDGISRSVDPSHDGVQALKPMNCPGHCVLFGMGMHSYRDLPLRVADFSTLHRNEISGALTGLTRVRSFTQDDAHIFCTRDQMSDELRSCLSFISDVYSTFNLPLKFKLSTRPENFIGETSAWDDAESALTETLNEAGLEWELNPGDGAFYGPKVDVAVRDALGRWHQCATVQLDFNLPVRFGLKYKGADGADHTPVMIHRAILGSIERFMAVLIEHTTGKLPLWLSPRQVLVCPVSPQFEDYARKVEAALTAQGLYATISDGHQSLAKQVKMAQPFAYNYIVIVGATEAEQETVSIRPRGAMGNEKDPMALDKFVQRLQSEMAQKL